MARPLSPSTSAFASIRALWVHAAIIGLPTGLTLWLYWLAAAPGLTWAHHGADGGDLLAAAVVNGVPHPSGYPLYTLLLRSWLWAGYLIAPQVESAFWGNRFSGLSVAIAAAFTAAAAYTLLRPLPLRWLWTILAGLAFAVTPLAWSQALITEVYALHALLVAMMGWAVLNKRIPYVVVGLLMGLGAAHHLTSLLLWPALLYWRLHDLPRRAWLGTAAQMVGVAILTALPFYGWIVWRVSSSTTAIPIAWGYPRDLSGLWWLVSGNAYRGYLFSMTLVEYGGRLASLARLLVEQFTPVGLALVIGGFAVWDRHRPTLRNGALAWMLPISLYAAGYNTVDSYIYLLPVVWLMALMAGQALASGSLWAGKHLSAAPGVIAAATLIGLVALTIWRFPQLDLRHDNEAQEFLKAASTLEANSLVISSADAPTFALWYGAWGTSIEDRDTGAEALQDLVIVNHALYQFGWYRDLLHDLYPWVPSMGAPFPELIAANRSLRPIYLTEALPEVPASDLEPAGPFWRLAAP